MSSFSFNFIPHEPNTLVDNVLEQDATLGIVDLERSNVMRGREVREVVCPPGWREARRLDQIGWVQVPWLKSQGSSEISHAKHAQKVLLRLSPQSKVFSPVSLQSRGVPPESDLVPGSYGGGYKVWECSLDLIEYVLASSPSAIKDSINLGKDSKGVKILELGCGHGLPGIASFAHLQGESLILADLNDGVLEDVTWPNILLNCSDEQHQRIWCLSGDWMELPEKLCSLEIAFPFDIILSAETLYTEENCRNMLQLLQHCLTSENGGGLALLANKRYYFGVGGGTSELLRIADAEFPSVFHIVRVKEFVDGSSNIRDILSVRRAV